MTYVLSDIHGNRENFLSVLKKISFSSKDKLYILGDVIDRRPYGIELLQQISEMPNAKMLLGNHEYMMLDAIDTDYDLDDPEDFENYTLRLSRWYRNGGDITHNFFLRLNDEERSKIISFLRSLPLSFNLMIKRKEFRLVHACEASLFDPELHYTYRDSKEFCVWHRFSSCPQESEKYTVVFGHTPTATYEYSDPLKVWFSEHKRVIGIDCGSSWPSEGYTDESGRPIHGRLACLRLEDLKVFYSEQNI